MPAYMPFVQVRPRKYKDHSPGKALFKVDVQKLRLAFEWLKKYNTFYYNVEWREDAAAAWEAEDVEIGVTRDRPSAKRTCRGAVVGESKCAGWEHQPCQIIVCV